MRFFGDNVESTPQRCSIFYERSLRNIEGNYDIIATLIWATARTGLGTTALGRAQLK